MISFFRKIRQKLLVENRVTRYLVYAFGEILLVVVGILIALWVNNLNEKSNQKEQGRIILQSFLQDLEEDSLYIFKRIIDAEKLIHDHREFVEKIEPVNNWDGLMEIRGLLNSPGLRVILQNTTYKELENSGDFDLVWDREIRKSLIAYYKAGEEAATHYEDYSAFTQDLLLNYFTDFDESMDISTIVDNYKDYDVSQSKIENNLSSEFKNRTILLAVFYANKDEVLLSYLQPLQEQGMILRERIQNELSSL